MPESNDVKSKLRQWAVAYGGKQLARFGYAAQDKLSGGATTSGNPDADRVELIVRRMEAQGRWREARVLRAEYFMEGLSEGERLTRLSRIGVSIGRSAYYAYLRSAVAFVEGAIFTVEAA
ncbi:hypothetical protein [Lysobacter enzymogenes]|uniref:hypothetical protein n=1 Tax=Lysobacter enzymogenes TaxID=69 RepID=UPI0009D4C5FE|nr:hypothetical protein [Lysobacter enzymogenes]UZW62745.1 hypothetical protein BV903_010825 [Lysobacter enzymogenes]